MKETTHKPRGYGIVNCLTQVVALTLRIVEFVFSGQPQARIGRSYSISDQQHLLRFFLLSQERRPEVCCEDRDEPAAQSSWPHLSWNHYRSTTLGDVMVTPPVACVANS